MFSIKLIVYHRASAFLYIKKIITLHRKCWVDGGKISFQNENNLSENTHSHAIEHRRLNCQRLTDWC